jgi:membrane protein implicated in regulation of membrane protease activity
MISVYLIIAIVCAILLMIMAFMGGFGGDAEIGGHDVDVGGHDMDMGHYDAGHGDYSGSSLSPLSIPVLLVFFTTFGSVGAILEATGLNWLVVPAVAAVCGVAMAGLLYVVVLKALVKSQGSTDTTPSELVGLDGLVTIAIKEGEPGQVVVSTEKRGRTTVKATAKGPIDSNVAVKVIGIAGDAVIVQKKEG